MKEQVLARDLAIFSIGLGLAELLTPRKVAELIGLHSDDHENLIRILGVREIASGLGIMQGNPKLFLWSRVAGDIIDLGLLAAAMKDDRNDRNKLQVAVASVATVTVCDIIGSVMHGREDTEPGWRVRGPGPYEGALSSDPPEARRASTDQAMSQFQSGHVGRAEIGCRASAGATRCVDALSRCSGRRPCPPRRINSLDIQIPGDRAGSWQRRVNRHADSPRMGYSLLCLFAPGCWGESGTFAGA